MALAWVLMVAGEIRTGRLVGMIESRARSVLVERFLRSFDVEVVKKSLSDVVAWKTLDPHISVSEQERMWQVVDEVGGATLA